MAQVKDFSDEEKKKTEEGADEAGQTGAAPVPGASAAGAPVGTGSAGRAAPKGTSSGAGNFTNVKKFLEVNKPKLGQAADTIGGGLTSRETGASTGLTTGRDTAEANIEAAELAGIDNVETATNRDLVASGEAERVFGDAGYQGTSGEDLQEQDRVATAAANKANERLQRTASEGGGAAAYRDQFGGRALTLAERSAFSRGGQLSQKLRDPRQEAALRNIGQKQRGLASAEAGGYGKLISDQAERAKGIRSGLSGRINQNASALDNLLSEEAGMVDANSRADTDAYRKGIGGIAAQDREAVMNNLISQKRSDGSSLWKANTDRLDNAVNEIMAQQQASAEYAPTYTSADALRDTQDKTGYAARAGALAKLAAMSGGDVGGLGYTASTGPRRNTRTGIGSSASRDELTQQFVDRIRAAESTGKNVAGNETLG